MATEAKEKLHPIVALWRTVGQNMSVREFKEWYWAQSESDRRELPELAAEELGYELVDEADLEPGSD